MGDLSQGLLCTSSDKVDGSLLEAAGYSIFVRFQVCSVYNSNCTITNVSYFHSGPRLLIPQFPGAQLRVVSTMSAGYDHIGKPSFSKQQQNESFHICTGQFFQTWKQCSAKWLLVTQQMPSLTLSLRLAFSIFSPALFASKFIFIFLTLSSASSFWNSKVGILTTVIYLYF